MNLEQLRGMMVIVEKGSFRAAAQHLNRSQSALSAMIKNFESEFEIVLFDRSKYRPTLTEAGAAFLEAAQATLEAAQFASRVARELGKKHIEPILHISVDPLVSREFIALIQAECAKPSHPVNLVMDYLISKDDHSALLSGKIDLSLAHCSPKTQNVERLFLERVNIVGAVPKKLLPKSQRLTESFLEKTTQIIAFDQHYEAPPGELIPQAAYKGGGPKIFVSDHFTKVRLIESGFGWGRISEQECNSSSKVAQINNKVFPKLTLDICLVRGRNRALGPVGQAIWKSFEAYQSRKS